MECFLQYWDNLDDVIGAFGLVAERLRRFLLFTVSTAVYLTLVYGGMLLALTDPPLALAVVTILAIWLLAKHRHLSKSRSWMLVNMLYVPTFRIRKINGNT